MAYNRKFLLSLND